VAALVRRRVPRSSAVVIDRPTGERVYIDLRNEQGRQQGQSRRLIRTTRTTRSGGILLEVDDAAGADTLADSVKAVVGVDTRVNRPERRTLVLLLDVPEWCEEAD